MESIYNLFYFVQGPIITELGVTVHKMNGSDDEKLKFLQNNIHSDFSQSKRFKVPSEFLNERESFDNADMLSMMRIGRGLYVFEEAFQLLGAVAQPLSVLTPVVDGEIEYDIRTGYESIPVSQFQGHPKLGAGTMSDYLEQYMVKGVLDIGTLLHNDHFIAIKNLFNNKHYLSSMKLMVSFIDTVGYLDNGDINENVFMKWLNEYSIIQPQLGISPEEFWEFRNSILHMTNLDSRKVKSGKIKRISLMVAPMNTPATSDHDTTYFNFTDLIFVVQNAIKNWLETYVVDPSKLVSFVKRYDRVISDSRLAKVS